MRILSLFVLSSCLLSCATIQQKKILTEHNTALSQALLLEENPRAQLDALSSSLIQMMNQSLDYVDPRKGLKFINKYKDLNNDSIQKILGNVEGWIGKMEPADQMMTGLSLLSDKNLQQLVLLAPKFEKKYKQIQLFSNVTNKIKGFFTN